MLKSGSVPSVISSRLGGRSLRMLPFQHVFSGFEYAGLSFPSSPVVSILVSVTKTLKHASVPRQCARYQPAVKHT
jgi:hypothetical protein